MAHNENSSNICYFLAALGKPHIEQKIKILETNLKILFKSTGKKIDLFVNIYDDTDLNNYPQLNQYIDMINIQRKKGILAELWKTGVFHDKLVNYDYIIFILDDILLTNNFNLDGLIKKKNKHGFDIISPCVTDAWHEYMHKRNDKVITTRNNHIEMFFYFMTPDGYFKYLNTVDAENAWIWGNDLVLGYFGLKVGIDYENEVTHMIKGNESNASIAHAMLDKYLAKNKLDWLDLVTNYPAIAECFYN